LKLALDIITFFIEVTFAYFSDNSDKLSMYFEEVGLAFACFWVSLTIWFAMRLESYPSTFLKYNLTKKNTYKTKVLVQTFRTINNGDKIYLFYLKIECLLNLIKVIIEEEHLTL
jgi:hypothetical protein